MMRLLINALFLLPTQSLNAGSEPYFSLADYDAASDREYVGAVGILSRPDLGLVIPVTVQSGGALLLGDPPVDKIPSTAVKRAVCGQAITFPNLPDRNLVCR